MGAGVVLHIAGPRHVLLEAARRDRLLELGEYLRVRLVQHVRHYVEPAAVRHPDQDVAGAGLRGVADQLVEDRDEHVEPLDREAGLAGEHALQETLEGLDLRQPLEQRHGIDRIRRRPEPAAFGRVTEPVALLRHEHVRVVVPDRRAVDAAEGVDRLEHVRRDVADRRGEQVRRQTAQIVDGDVVRLGKQGGIADRLPEPEWIERGRQMPVPADGLRQVGRADDGLERDALDRRRRLGRRGPLLEERTRLGIDRGRILPVLFVELQHVAAVEPGEVLPRCHSPLILP
jgi:hypothetical protein